ncbi:MAG: helicase HerA-like domain-containing protein, partial [Gemmatimonadaceae bacterium]
PGLDIEQAILELAVGEALISLLDAKGTPGITERAWMLAPGSQIGPITPLERTVLVQHSVVAGVYEKVIDRESAYEILKARAATAASSAPAGQSAPAAPAGAAGTAGAVGAAVLGGLGGLLFGTTGPRGGKRDGLFDLVAKSAARSTGTAISRGLVRGVLGSLLGGKRR